MSEKRIVIVGGGIAGAATAWGLAGRGRGSEVVVVEQERQLGAHSTSRNAGILRTYTGEYGTDVFTRETAAFLAAPPASFTEVPLVDPVGLIMVPATFDPADFAAWRELKAPGTVVDLEPERFRELAPHWGGETHGAVLVTDEGNLDSSAIFDGYVRGARRGGVAFEHGARVTEFLGGPGRVTGVVLADGRRLEAELVVVAAGGWAGPLAARAGSTVHFEPRRRHLLVTAPDPRVDPRWPVVWSEVDSFYAKPESGGLMICCCDEDVVDADHCDERPEVIERIAQRATECLKGFDDAGAAHHWAGMRTFCEDHSFAVGPDPDVAGLFWVSGLGGHGICTSCGLGRFAAALLVGAEVDERVRAGMDPGRFGR